MHNVMGHEYFSHVGGWAATIFHMFEEGHENFKHHGTFHPPPSVAVIVDNSLTCIDLAFSVGVVTGIW